MVDVSEFKFNNYPDGHKHIVSDKDLHGDQTLSVSITSFDELFKVAQIKAIHPELEYLTVKYMLAGRCDRRFSPGEALDLKIVCDFINSLEFKEVTVIRPHSLKTLELLKNAHEHDVTDKMLTILRYDLGEDAKICYVAPDQGAARWIGNNAAYPGVSPLIYGSKKRDADGKVLGVQFKRNRVFSDQIEDTLDINIKNDHFVIIDDLCDGGATFTTIADEIHSRAPNAKVYLVVTHAIFSKGLSVFDGKIERIYCTNSFPHNQQGPLIHQIEI
jgi:ribose-phosphate pyrophosphokinase